MTSTLSIHSGQPGLAGRTVRDIVEHEPAQVDEAWCRKILRQILQSLELQYATRMPRQAITPDTVVFEGNGEPRMLPTELPGAAHDEAADLTALARVIHFAITRELVPEGPLRGRALEGYSDSLLGAVDRCMAADPAERPRSIGELRDMLGIVTLAAAMPAAASSRAAATGAVTPPFVRGSGSGEAPPALLRESALDMGAPAPLRESAAGEPAPAFTSEPSPGGTRIGGLSRSQRWALAGGGAAALLAIALALFAELRDAGSHDHIASTLPQSGEPARGNAAAAPPAAAAATIPYPAGAADAPPPAAPGLPAGPAQANGAEAAGASAAFRLQIRPWGTVYVDGVDHGVSPPVKRLVLAPGKHTLRIANPNFRDRVLEVDAGAGGGQIAVDFNESTR